jgi:ABC-2 type transport system ATP-binding protein
MTEHIVETENVVRDFGKRRAVDGISLTLAPGQILALIGPNGAGKTTLLKVLAGLISPTTGEARVMGQPSFPPCANVAAHVGCVLDGAEPPPRTRVRQVLDLRAAVDRAFNTPRAVQLCEGHDIGLNQRWHTLSKGQRRWVLAVSALAAGAALLLLDEPADGLDPAARQELYGMLRDEANERNTAAIVASHILADVERVADEVAIIQRGHLKLRGNLEELRDSVREVEFAADVNPTTALPSGAQLLGSEKSETTQTLWIAYKSESSADLPVPNEIERRAVNLERLYFVITEHSSDSCQYEPDSLEPATSA